MAPEFVPSPQTLSEAMQVLGPIGLGVVILGGMLLFYGIRRAPATSSDKPQQVGIQALIADHLAMDRAITGIHRLADSQEDLAKAINRACDMMDLTSALQKLQGRSGPPAE